MSDDYALFPKLTAPPAAAPPIATVARPFRPARELYTGRPTVAVQVAAPDHIGRVAQICQDTAFGAVLTVDSRNTNPGAALGNLMSAFTAVTSDSTHVLVDANRYSGKGRIIGSHHLDPTFVRAQLDSGAAVGLTDSPYIPDGDHASLESTLAQAAAMGMPTLVALPLANGWFATPREATYLKETISRFGLPVALMIEHRDDPFGVARIVRGVLSVLQADVPVLMLRSDLSVLGAVAHGAAGGAIGTVTSLRHIYPMPTDGKKGGPGRGRPAAWVPRLLGYHALDTLGDVALFDEVNQYLLCDCVRCSGLGVERIATEAEAFDHSLRAIGDFAAKFLDASKSPDALCAAWHLACENAQFGYLHVESVTAANLPTPDFLGAWRSAHPQ